MARTARATRILGYKKKYNKDGATFHDRFAAVNFLLEVPRVSLASLRWVEKKIYEMQIMYGDAQAHIQDMNFLNEKLEESKAKFGKRMINLETRRINRAAKRETKKQEREAKRLRKLEEVLPIKFGRKNDPVPPTNDDVPVWMKLAQEQEKK